MSFRPDSGQEPKHCKWKDLKPGFTLCMLNPITHEIYDGSLSGAHGVREDDLDGTFVFPMSHKNLILEVKKWLAPKSCAGCGETEKSLKGDLI